MFDLSSITSRIEGDYQNLPPRVRKAARYVVKAPMEVAMYSLRKVAERADVGPTTFVRLASHFGFASYNAFREVFREALGQGLHRYASNARELQQYRARTDFELFYKKTGDVIVQNINATFSSITAADIAAAGEVMCEARRIYIVGLRCNYSLSFYLYYVLRTFMRNVVLLESNMGMLIDDLGRIGAKDVLVAISYEPYAIEAVKASEYAASAGARVIALTDTMLSPIAQPAANVLVIPPCGTSLYQSLAPSMALLEGLVSYVASRGGKRMVQNVKDEFERRESFGVYWRDRG